MPRIVRGTFAKLMPVCISYLNSVEDKNYDASFALVKDYMLEFVDCLESDIYSIIDDIEPEQLK